MGMAVEAASILIEVRNLRREDFLNDYYEKILRGLEIVEKLVERL